MRRVLLGFISLMFLFGATSVWAYASWQDGHISNITYGADFMLIMLDTGVPTNCAGTPSGWMKIPAQNKPMLAFVTGLWMRGDASQISVTVYTDGIGASGFCEINQIDPVN